MEKFLIAALAGLFLAQPAAAATTLGDFNVYADGSVYISGGSYGDIGAGSFTNANGASGTNFTSKQASTAALTAQTTALSDSYAAMAATGSFSSLNGWGTLTGTQSGVNVYTLSVSQLSSLHDLAFAGIGSGAILNITGTGSLTTSVHFDFGSLSDPSQVLLNFVDLDSVRFNGPNFKGSILAPDALLRLQGGIVDGSVASKSFYSEGTTIGGNGFSGFSAPPTPSATTPPVPEPSTWMTLLVGFAAVGIAMRRRKAPMQRMRLAPDNAW